MLKSSRISLGLMVGSTLLVFTDALLRQETRLPQLYPTIPPVRLSPVPHRTQPFQWQQNRWILARHALKFRICPGAKSACSCVGDVAERREFRKKFLERSSITGGARGISSPRPAAATLLSHTTPGNHIWWCTFLLTWAWDTSFLCFKITGELWLPPPRHPAPSPECISHWRNGHYAQPSAFYLSPASSSALQALDRYDFFLSDD